MAEYPKTKYPEHSGGSITVETPEQEKALGPGWVDHPPPAPEPDETQDLHRNPMQGTQDTHQPKPRRKKEQPSLESI